MSDINSVQICNTGVQAVGEFLVRLLEKPEDFCEQNQMKQTASELICFALTLLRFIYSTERNRRNFKLLFSPQIFGLFVDIGNFNRNPQACAGLVPRLMKLSSEEIKKMERNFAELQQQHTAGSGKQVGGYTLKELIGTGSYGQVYSAQKGDSLFAVKEIQIEEEHGLEERILKEVSILKQLDHPNIVKYYNSFKEGDALYLVMELVDGQSLLELVTSRKQKKLFLKESQIWSMVSQLCSALRYLHSEKKIMHRDIAPSNVLLDLKTSRIKLADFGLAKHYARKDDGMLASQSSSVMKSTFAGTIVYSSPEIVQSEPYSSKADIWSLGCVLYELCALQAAFPGTNPLTIAKKIVECDYIPLDESHYSAPLLKLIRSCMTREAQKRPNIDQLCQAITPIFMEQLDELRRKEETISYELESMKQETMLMKMIEQESKEEEPQLLKVEILTKMQDPVVFILGLLHKINYLVDRCPSLQGDHRYTYVEQFKRHLYDCGSIHEMKKILFKLQSALKEPINPEMFGQLSYEQMSIVLDECAIELNYKL